MKVLESILFISMPKESDYLQERKEIAVKQRSLPLTFQEIYLLMSHPNSPMMYSKNSNYNPKSNPF